MIFAFPKYASLSMPKLYQPRRMRFSAIKDAGFGWKREIRGKSVEQAHIGGTAIKLSDGFG